MRITSRGLPDHSSLPWRPCRARIDGVIVLLADMPFITATHINELLAEFNPTTEARYSGAHTRQARGQPDHLGRPVFPAMMKLEGDRGRGGCSMSSPPMYGKVPMGTMQFLWTWTRPRPWPRPTAIVSNRCE